MKIYTSISIWRELFYLHLIVIFCFLGVKTLSLRIERSTKMHKPRKSGMISFKVKDETDFRIC